MAKVTAPCQYCGSCSIWLAASEWIEPGAQSEAEIEGIVDDAYAEQMEGWLEYKAVPIPFGRMCDSDCDEDDAYDDDDADCYTDD